MVAIDGEVGPSAAAAIMAKLGDVGTAVAVMQTDVGYLKAQSVVNAANIGRALDGISTASADASTTPAGRELLRRLVLAESINATVDARLDTLEDFRDNVTASMRLLRAEASFATVLAAVITIIWTGHALGWW